MPIPLDSTTAQVQSLEAAVIAGQIAVLLASARRHNCTSPLSTHNSRFQFEFGATTQHPSPEEESRLAQGWGTVCPCAPASRALRPKDSLPPKHWAQLRKHACASPTNGLCPFCYSSSGWGSWASTPPLCPFQPHPFKYEGGNDDSTKENGGGFHFGAFLSLAEAIGWRDVKEAGRIAAGSVPPLEPGDAAQELSLSCFFPGSSVLLRFLLRLGSCCYLRT